MIARGESSDRRRKSDRRDLSFRFGFQRLRGILSPGSINNLTGYTKPAGFSGESPHKITTMLGGDFTPQENYL